MEFNKLQESLYICLMSKPSYFKSEWYSTLQRLALIIYGITDFTSLFSQALGLEVGVTSLVLNNLRTKVDL